MSYFNHPVKVAVFQAAIVSLVERLLRKAGRTEDVLVQTLFTGETACAVWAYSVAYDDRGNIMQTIRGTIKLPELRENSVITRDKANRWVGYVIHEVWHIVFTDADEWKRHVTLAPGLRSKLANALEDARIERSGMELGYADGFKVVGKDLLAHLMTSGGMDVNPNDPLQIPWALAVYARGYGVKGEKRLLSALDPRVEKIFAEAKKRVQAIPANIANAQGTAQVNVIALWVYAQLKKLGKEPPLPPPQPPDTPPDNPGPEPRRRPRDDDEGADRDDHDEEREGGDAGEETYDDEDQPEGPKGGKSKGGSPMPLVVGDKVQCPDGSNGVITAINGDDAEVAPL